MNEYSREYAREIALIRSIFTHQNAANIVLLGELTALTQTPSLIKGPYFWGDGM